MGQSVQVSLRVWHLHRGLSEGKVEPCGHLGKEHSQRGNTKYKGPEVGVFSRNSNTRRPSVARAQQATVKEAGDKEAGRDLQGLVGLVRIWVLNQYRKKSLEGDSRNNQT